MNKLTPEKLADINAIIKSVRRFTPLSHTVIMWEADWQILKQHIDAQAAEIERLRAALRFYADEKNYRDEELVEYIEGIPRYEHRAIAVLIDEGNIAQQALNPTDTTRKSM